MVHLCEAHGVSQRRACDVLQIDRSTVRYLSRRGDDVELRDAIKRVSRERRRFGCRRIHVMISREGFEVNHKKVRRIYREEKLQVRRRGGRKRALGTRKPMVLPPLIVCMQTTAGQWMITAERTWRLWRIHRCPDTALHVSWTR